MGSFSRLGICLSVMFGCIFLVFVAAELYYLLWWKKRIANCNGDMKEFSFLFCWKKPTSFRSASSGQECANAQETINGGHVQQDLEMASSQDFALKGYGEEGVDTELIRLYSLRGPPRFLFTIKEENKEDMESEEGRSRGEISSGKGSKTSSLSELIAADETPFFTPLSSPTNMHPIYLDTYYREFNPIFEPVTETELDRLRSSPPPTFKFMKDAEDKFIKRLMEETLRNQGLVTEFGVKNSHESSVVIQEDDSFVSCIDKRLLRGQIHYQASQVLPLASSPTLEQVLGKKSSVK